MDDKLTKSIQDWLELPAAERDIPLGAEMLLRLNRNRILYQNILRRPEKMAAKLEHELRKFLRIRLDRMTMADVQRLDKEVTARATQSLEAGAPLPSGEEPDPEDKAPHRGRRDDHEQLPEDIRALYDRNGEVYDKLRRCYDTLRRMEQAAPCDHYAYLKVLDSLDKEYRANWLEYDSYTPPTAEASEETEAACHAEPVEASEAPPAVPTAKEVAAARKYVSTNRKKLAAAPEDEALLEEMQQRIDIVKAAGGEFKPDIRDELETLGLKFD